MNYPIDPYSKEDINTINFELGNFNKSKVPYMLEFDWKRLEFGIYDQQKELIGGILSWVSGLGSLYINQL